MKTNKLIALVMAILIIVFAFGGCKSDNDSNETKSNTSKTNSSEEEKLKYPLEISLKREDAVAFAGLISNNNAGKTNEVYYINYRESADEITKLLKNGNADVGVLPLDDALSLCEENKAMRIVAVNESSNFFCLAKKQITSLDEVEKAKILLLKNDKKTKNLIAEILPKSAKLETTTDLKDAKTLFNSGLYDVVLGDYSTVYNFCNKEFSEISDVSTLFDLELSSFALVTEFETYIGNVDGFKSLKAELSASASSVTAEQLSDLYIIDNLEKAKGIAENLRFNIKFFAECKSTLENIEGVNDSYFLAEP